MIKITAFSYLCFAFVMANFDATTWDIKTRIFMLVLIFAVNLFIWAVKEDD